MILPHDDSMTVFVVDDDQSVRQSLVMILQSLGHPVRGCASAAEFRKLYHKPARGVLVVDMHMPDETGLELCQDLKRQGISLPVLFLSANAEVSTAVAAMKAGAIDFLQKPIDGKVFVRQVEQALAVAREQQLRDERFRQIDAQINKLTRIDRETLQLILNGETNKKMAALLRVTERAVELRRQRLMKRLGTRSLAELLDLAVTHRELNEIRQLALTSSLEASEA